MGLWFGGRIQLLSHLLVETSPSTPMAPLSSTPRPISRAVLGQQATQSAPWSRGCNEQVPHRFTFVCFGFRPDDRCSKHDCRANTTLAYSSVISFVSSNSTGAAMNTTGATLLVVGCGLGSSTGASSSPSNTWTATGATLNSDLNIYYAYAPRPVRRNLRLCRRIVIRLRALALKELSPHLPCSIIVQYVADLLQLLRLPQLQQYPGSGSHYFMESRRGLRLRFSGRLPDMEYGYV